MGGYSVVISLGNERVTLVEEKEFLYRVGDRVSLAYNNDEKILIGEQKRC